VIPAIDHESLVEWQIGQRLRGVLGLGKEDAIDPLRRLHDPSFTDTLWEYDGSYIGEMVPGSLHEKQVEAFLASATHRHRFLFWGNQVGKTTEGAQECAMVALKRHPHIRVQGSALIWASALTWELWENILLPELLTWIPPERIILAPEPFKSTPGRRTIVVRADDGTLSRIVGKSVQQGRKSYQSAKVHFCWMDEEHPEAIWNELMLRLVRFGGRTLTTATPLLGLTWLYFRMYLSWQRGTDPDVWCSHAGLMDNPSIGEEQIEFVRRQFAGNPAELAARLFGKFAKPAGLALSSYDPGRNLETFTREMALAANEPSPRGGKGWTHVCGLDFQYWRFGLVHGMVDHAGRLHIVKEYFSQKQTLSVRARWIHNHLTDWGAPPDTRLWGDCANPTDINELNVEFQRIGSPFRVRAVRGESKARATGTKVLNNMLERGTLLISRDVAEDGKVWYRGQNAASEGQPMADSRLLFEIGQWRYPTPKPKNDADRAQTDDPDDDTADGADLIAALRYLVMSHFRPPKKGKVPEAPKDRNFDDGFERMKKAVQQKLKREGAAA